MDIVDALFKGDQDLLVLLRDVHTLFCLGGARAALPLRIRSCHPHEVVLSAADLAVYFQSRYGRVFLDRKCNFRD